MYPALEDSDYEDTSPRPPKKKKVSKDQSWLPNGKASVATREKRPARENAVKPSVKAELDMTREYLKDKPTSSSTTRVCNMPIKLLLIIWSCPFHEQTTSS